MFQFSSIIRKYSQPISLKEKSNGTLVNGEYIAGTTTNHEVKVAVFYMSPEQVSLYDGGTYTTQDLVIYASENIRDLDTDVLINITKDDLIEYNGDNFKIMDKLSRFNRSDFVVFAGRKVVIDND